MIDWIANIRKHPSDTLRSGHQFAYDIESTKRFIILIQLSLKFDP